MIRADLPGIDPERDLDVHVENGRLVVTGERREEYHEKNRSEVHYGSFARTLPLPAGVAADDITASYTTVSSRCGFRSGSPSRNRTRSRSRVRRPDMEATVGDRLVIPSAHTNGPVRDGEILEVHGEHGSPPYLVRWAGTGRRSTWCAWTRSACSRADPSIGA